MIINKYQQYLFDNYTRYPLHLVRGEGAYVWDAEGKKYLDFLSGIACTPLGHCHPAVNAAIIQQLNHLLHTSNLYYTTPAVELAECLVQNGGLDKVFFCNSGTEANEAAIKLARKFQYSLGKTAKTTILSVDHSFHGRTLGALAATAKPSIKVGFSPLPENFKHHSWENIEEFCQQITDDVAAVIIEPVQGEGGVCPASPEFLRMVRKSCNATGALLIFDEVQCGIGRTGHLFAYQYFNVKPDIITLAKGLANGLPIGALCAKNHIAQALKPGDHGSTFGGNPVSCQAALAVMNTLLKEDYLARIQKLSNDLFGYLHGLKNSYPDIIKETRGVGLMASIELSRNANPLLNYCREQGILINLTGDNMIRLLPPYIINEGNIAHFAEVLKATFTANY